MALLCAHADVLGSLLSANVWSLGSESMCRRAWVVSVIVTVASRNCDIIVIVIVISKLLKRYTKAKRTRAPAYSRALRRIKGGFPKGGQKKLRSDFQSTRR